LNRRGVFLLLALDTASQFMSLALHDGRQIRFELTWQTLNNHTTELTPAIQQALSQTRITVRDLTAIAVSQGPGSFTGLRIGMGVAKGLALARKIPLVAVPTPDIMTGGIPPFHGPLIAVLQVGRGRVCAQRYRWNKNAWLPAAQAEITGWEKLIGTIEQETLIAGEIDEGGHALLDATERPVRIAPGALALRRAGFLAEIAWVRLDAEDTDEPASVTPIYLHQPGVPHP
jgi:tRNA threonylcarbamoyladenosine biosynthesis protein TsaB